MLVFQLERAVVAGVIKCQHMLFDVRQRRQGHDDAGAEEAGLITLAVKVILWPAFCGKHFSIVEVGGDRVGWLRANPDAGRHDICCARRIGGLLDFNGQQQRNRFDRFDRKPGLR